MRLTRFRLDNLKALIGSTRYQEGWQLNEHKAWTEFVEEHNIKFEWVAFG